MAATLVRLFPSLAEQVPLEGLYLNSPLLPPGWRKRLFVYTNFVSSLDGRIAISDSGTGQTIVPDTIANPRDWRLFQELAAHADVLLTSGRYLRDLAAGIAQDSMPLSDKPAFADLKAWRMKHGLHVQPDIAVMSLSLDFTLPHDWFIQGRRVLVLTVSGGNFEAVARLRRQGAEVIEFPGITRVSGREVVNCLGNLGYRRLYSVAGPYVLQSLLADGVLDTLFLTTVHRLVGGTQAPGILEGPPLPVPVDFRLTSLYFDSSAQKNLSQSLARYDRPE